MAAGNFKTSCVWRDIDTNHNSSDIAILGLVGQNNRVLGLGCGAGHMSQALQAQACHVVGIEINPEAAERASAFCEKVIVADLDYMSFDQELGSDRFDVVIAADVVEQLKDPMPVLSSIRNFLAT